MQKNKKVIRRDRARECSEETNFLSCLWLFGLLLKTEHMGKPRGITSHSSQHREVVGMFGRHVRQKELAPSAKPTEGEKYGDFPENQNA